MTNAANTRVEHKNPQHMLFDTDEQFLMQGYEGTPEFDLYERTNYNTQSVEERAPALLYTSNVGPNELLPQHDDNTMDYQKLHPELERWAIFRSLPPLMRFEKKFVQTLKDMQAGLIFVPNFMAIINPPTLLTYYLTLPKWLRETTCITNVFYALEYHQTRTSTK